MRVFLALAVVVFSSLGFANVRCSNPEFGRVTKSGKIYTFSIFQDCKVTGLTHQGILEQYQHQWSTVSDIDVISSKDHSQEGYSGSLWKTFSEERAGGGTMKVTGDLFLGESDQGFLFDSRSTDITGRGNGKYTKAVKFRLDAKTVSNHLVLNFHQIIEVKKPGIVSSSYFVKRVKRGMMNAQSDIIEQHLQLMIPEGASISTGSSWSL